jgi:anti-sigma regulatory factor (Ser/Thr protein kinase)
MLCFMSVEQDLATSDTVVLGCGDSDLCTTSNIFLRVHQRNPQRVQLQIGGIPDEHFQSLDFSVRRRIEAIQIERELEHSGLVAGDVKAPAPQLDVAAEWVWRFADAYEEGGVDKILPQYIDILLGVRDQVRTLDIVRSDSEAPTWNTIGKLDRDWPFCPELELAQRQAQNLIVSLVPEPHQLRVRGALEEAFPNHLRHGNACDPRKIVVVDAMKEAAALQVQSVDQGRGFRHADVDDPTNEDNLERPFGRGLLMMNAFMDEVRYAMGGRMLLMTKKW